MDQLAAIIKLNASEFQKIATFVYQHSGISLAPSKMALMEGRLQRILKSLQIRSFEEYLRFLKSSKCNGEHISALVDRMSTNHTYFWREEKHFELFENTFLPEAIARNANTKKLRVWCSACSRGHEAYTLAAIMKKSLGYNASSWDSGLLATDISSTVLKEASDGIYLKDDTKSLPSQLENGMFDSYSEIENVVKSSLKKDITFRRFNLLNNFPFKGKFDIIFCRNVMIYFDEATKMAIANKMFQILNPGGYFVVSLSESLKNRSTPFTHISPGVYQKK